MALPNSQLPSSTVAEIVNIVNEAMAEGEIQSPVSGGGISVRPITALMRNWSMGAQMVTGSSSVAQWGKYCTDAPFSGIRLWVYSDDPNRTSNNWEAAVAPTDEPLNDSSVNAYRPRVGGTTYNVYASNSTANMYGWRRASWGNVSANGGQSKSGILMPGGRAYYAGSVLPNTIPVPGVIQSDWIDCDAVPSNNGDGRFYHLLRLYRAAGNGFASFAGNGVGAASGVTASVGWRNGLGQPWHRRMMHESGSTDGVNTLANYPTNTSITEANYAFLPAPIGIEYRYTVPVRSIFAIGDSITEGGGYQLYGYNTWLIQAAYAKSTAAAPIVPFNGGYSTTTEEQYTAQFECLLLHGARPTDVVWWNMSFNNLSTYGSSNSGTRYLIQQVKARNLRMLELCKRIGAQPYICTNYYFMTGSGVAECDSMIAEIDTWTKAVCSSGAAKLVDVRGGWSNATHLGADQVHPSQAGIDYIAGLLSAQL